MHFCVVFIEFFEGLNIGSSNHWGIGNLCCDVSLGRIVEVRDQIDVWTVMAIGDGDGVGESDGVGDGNGFGDGDGVGDCDGVGCGDGTGCGDGFVNGDGDSAEIAYTRDNVVDPFISFAGPAFIQYYPSVLVPSPSPSPPLNAVKYGLSSLGSFHEFLFVAPCCLLPNFGLDGPSPSS